MPDQLHDLYDVMRATPSTRRFTDEPVERAALERVLDHARFAPSGGNRQGWRVIVVTDAESRRHLRELYAEPWEAYMERTGGRAALDDPEGSGLPPGRLKGIADADEYARTFDRAPVHLIPCVQIEALVITDSQLDRPSIVGGASIYPFVHNILLGLRREGLGASFSTLLVPAEPQVRELLGIPTGIAMAGHISVGHRADPWPGRLRRNPVSEFAYGETFGRLW